MMFRTTTRVAIELTARIRTRSKSPMQWNARTIEVGRDELWLVCESAEGIQLPQRGGTFLVTIDLPVSESVTRRCMECHTELLAVETVDPSTARLRMRVVAMKIRDRDSAGPAADATKLVM